MYSTTLARCLKTVFRHLRPIADQFNCLGWNNPAVGCIVSFLGTVLGSDDTLDSLRPSMKNLTFFGWLAFAVFVAWFAYNHMQPKDLQDCQHYDSLGRGIGCEGADLADM
jgi:hypothetical protein